MAEQKRAFLNFVQDVNLLLKMRAGVSYAEVMRFIHPDQEAPRAALDNGVDPAAFVEEIMAGENFMPVGDDVAAEEAGSYNAAVAAIAAFAFANRDNWHRTDDAVYFSAVGDDHTIFLRPVFSHGLNAFVIGAEVREGASLNAEGTSFAAFGDVVGRFPGPDIGEAVDKANDYLESVKTHDFSTVR